MMLKNPVYTGRIVWNRLDFTEAKHSGGGARRRAREEWVVTEEAHLPLVSDDVYEAAQARFEKTVRSQASAQQIGELDRKIKAQVQALERGIEPELVSERIGELRNEKEALEEALAGIGAERQEAEDEELIAQLERIPDLTEALRTASVQIKRQVFESFDLRIDYDKQERRVELSATVSEAVAEAFQNAEALLAEGSSVVVTNIAGAGFEPATSGL